jgi:hypothetical protein
LRADHDIGGTALALQGTLDTFSLPDVLRLLATTSKTGCLRIEGDRGQGNVWLDGGSVVDADADRAVEGTPTDEVVFELLRFDTGSFAFDADDRSPQAGNGGGEDVEDVLRRATALLGEWSELEAVVPSLAHHVSLAIDLSADEVTIDADRWRSVVAVAGGRTVGELASELGLTELGVSRAVRDLVELGVADIEAPAGVTRRDAPDLTRRPAAVADVGIPEPLGEGHRAGWMQGDRTGEMPAVSDPRTPAGATNGQSQSRDDMPSLQAPGEPPGRPARRPSGRTRPGAPTSGAAPAMPDLPPARSDDAGRPADAPRPSLRPEADRRGPNAVETGRVPAVRPGDTGNPPAVRPDADRIPPPGVRPATDRMPSGPAEPGRTSARPSGEPGRTPARPPADRMPSGPAEPGRTTARPPVEPGRAPGRSSSEAPRRPGGSRGDAGRVPPPSPPGGERNGSGTARREPGAGPPFDNGRLGPAPLGGDTGQIRPVSPSSLPPDLHWAADDLSNTGPVGPITGPVSSPFSGLSSLGPPRPPVPDNSGEIAPHVAAMSPEARSAVQATVGNNGGSAGGSRLAPGDDAAQRGRLISFLSTVR